MFKEFFKVVACVSMLLFSNCKKQDVIKPLDVILYPVKLSVSTFSQQIMTLSSIQPQKGNKFLASVGKLTYSKSNTIGIEGLKKVINNINYCIYDATGKLVATYYQVAQEEQFGNISLGLATGEYTVVVMGSSLLNDTAIGSTINDTYLREYDVADVFAKKVFISVKDFPATESIVLERVKGMLELNLTDVKIPDDVIGITVTIVNASKFYYFKNMQGQLGNTLSYGFHIDRTAPLVFGMYSYVFDDGTAPLYVKVIIQATQLKEVCS